MSAPSARSVAAHAAASLSATQPTMSSDLSRRCFCSFPAHTLGKCPKSPSSPSANPAVLDKYIREHINKLPKQQQAAVFAQILNIYGGLSRKEPVYVHIDNLGDPYGIECEQRNTSVHSGIEDVLRSVQKAGVLHYVFRQPTGPVCRVAMPRIGSLNKAIYLQEKCKVEKMCETSETIGGSSHNVGTKRVHLFDVSPLSSETSSGIAQSESIGNGTQNTPVEQQTKPSIPPRGDSYYVATNTYSRRANIPDSGEARPNPKKRKGRGDADARHEHPLPPKPPPKKAKHDSSLPQEPPRHAPTPPNPKPAVTTSTGHPAQAETRQPRPSKQGQSAQQPRFQPAAPKPPVDDAHFAHSVHERARRYYVHKPKPTPEVKTEILRRLRGQHFAVLGVAATPALTATAVKRAYMQLSLEHHPDKNPGDPLAAERFRIVAEAYEALKDDIKRISYLAQVQREKRDRGTWNYTGFSGGPERPPKSQQ